MVLTTAVAAAFALAPMGPASAASFPDTLALPNGWLSRGRLDLEG